MRKQKRTSKRDAEPDKDCTLRGLKKPDLTTANPDEGKLTADEGHRGSRALG